MGSNPKFDNYEVNALLPKEVKVNSIDWCEILSWIPRGSCNNINWCRLRIFYWQWWWWWRWLFVWSSCRIRGKCSTRWSICGAGRHLLKDLQLLGLILFPCLWDLQNNLNNPCSNRTGESKLFHPVFHIYSVVGASSTMVMLSFSSDDYVSSAMVMLSFWSDDSVLDSSSFLSLSSMWFELAASGSQAIGYLCRDKDFNFIKYGKAVMQLEGAFKEKEGAQMRNNNLREGVSMLM